MANPGKALASDSEDDDDRVEDVPEVEKEVDRDEPAAKKMGFVSRTTTTTTTDDNGVSTRRCAQVKTMMKKKASKGDDDDDDDSDDDGSVDSECIDDLSGDEVDTSNIISGGRSSRRGRPTVFTAQMYAQGGLGSDSDDE